MFDPEKVRALCQMPIGIAPIALLCVGHVATFYPESMLQSERWDTRRPIAEIIYENAWGVHAAPQGD